MIGTILVPLDGSVLAEGALLVECPDVGARRGQRGPQQMCCACGAITDLYGRVQYVRQGDARFCPTCWHDLSPETIGRLVREVALRGVPLS